MVNIYNMNNIYEETKFLMKKYNLTANKKLGQNFLVDSEAINSIVASANLTKKDMVIEIGPGLGTLTSMLIEKAGKVIAIELDDRMIKILGDRFLLYDNFELINEDVLKVDLSSLIEKNSEFENIKVVANLPYYITTPIIMKLLENRLKIESITIMIQKEVAERIVATPGSKLSGAITYSVHYYAEPEKIALVPNTSFIPSPEVDSEVIKLNIRKSPPVKIDNEKLFFNVIKASFMQRRKTLSNGLVNGGIVKNKAKAIEILKNMGLEYTESRMNHPSIASGYVIKTEPTKGSEVKAGTTVTVYVSLGAQTVMKQVPDVTGINVDDAKRVLESYGLKVGEVKLDETSDEPYGTVLFQDPAEGDMVATGSFVNLTISQGDTVVSRLTITVPLPSSIDRDVTVSAYLDDMEVRRETINPKNTTSWKPSFSGEGIGRVKIYIDDEIYMEYIVDFDEGIHEIDSDYSQDFQ